MVYAHRRGPRDSKKMKHKRRDPGNSVSSSRSNFARAMRGHTLKLRNFPALFRRWKPSKQLLNKLRGK